MRLIAAISVLIIICSCNNNSSSETTASSTLPARPGSIESVQASLKGKNFKAVNAGTVSSFEMDKDNPYEWQDRMQDSTAKNYMKERMGFRLNFLNDTAVIVFDDNQEKTGTWKIDTTTEDGMQGMKLRISVMDFTFGNEMMPVTYTYVINGISDKQLFLLTPRDFNRRKIVVLMEAK
jgi:hypothetical protein